MRVLRYCIISICFILYSISALASTEGMLPISSFSLRSQGLGSSGSIELTGSQSSNGISNLRIVSFGHEFVLTAPLILQLHNFSANGIQLSYEEGYKEYGGKTLYVTFTQGFTFGVVRLKVLSVNEKGSIRIFDKEFNKE